jgi:hypothetical protein
MKAALIEFNDFHDELLYSQLKFLKDGKYSTTLIANEKLKNQTDIYEGLTEKVIFYEKSTLKRLVKFIRIFILLFSCDKIIFNTASSKIEIIILCLLLPKRIEKFGTLHNLNKISQSTSQKLISKGIKHYFVINDYLLKSRFLNGFQTKTYSFYPIFFPYDTMQEELNKSENEIWFCIPGSVSSKRRDYQSVLEVAKQLKGNNKLKFIFLGKISKSNKEHSEFLKFIQENGLENLFLLFDSFIDNNLFHTYLHKSDFLFQPMNETHSQYVEQKTSGIFNLAFAYKKAVITHESMRIIDDLQDISFFYKDRIELKETIIELLNSNINKIQEKEKWQYEFQKNKYLSVIS